MVYGSYGWCADDVVLHQEKSQETQNIIEDAKVAFQEGNENRGYLLCEEIIYNFPDSSIAAEAMLIEMAFYGAKVSLIGDLLLSYCHQIGLSVRKDKKSRGWSSKSPTIKTVKDMNTTRARAMGIFRSVVGKYRKTFSTTSLTHNNPPIFLPPPKTKIPDINGTPEIHELKTYNIPFVLFVDENGPLFNALSLEYLVAETEFKNLLVTDTKLTRSAIPSTIYDCDLHFDRLSILPVITECKRIRSLQGPEPMTAILKGFTHSRIAAIEELESQSWRSKPDWGIHREVKNSWDLFRWLVEDFGASSPELIGATSLFSLIGTEEKGPHAINEKIDDDIFFEIGHSAAQRIDSKIPTSVHSEVSRIGRRVAASSPATKKTYTFKILSLDEINAFSLPNGTIYLMQGLIDLLEDSKNFEEEIAAVIGHEIAHVVHKHPCETTISIMGPEIGMVIAGNLSTVANRKIYADLLTTYASEFTLFSFSREQELLADREGIQYVIRAGYDPDGMRFFLKKLGDLEESITLPYETRHPSIGNRLIGLLNKE